MGLSFPSAVFTIYLGQNIPFAVRMAKERYIFISKTVTSKTVFDSGVMRR